MTNKIKLVNYYQTRKEKQGTKTIGESMTNQSQAEECDIYACLNKYGITALVNQTQAKEFLYADSRNLDMDLAEAVRTRKELNEYFKEQPARVRKVFGDNVDNFIEKYRRGEFEEMLQTGILSQDQVNELTKEEEKTEIELPKTDMAEKEVTQNEQI